MRVCNLFAGLGGNRKLWTPNGDEHEITAVEINPEIAKIYQDYFPNDTVIVGDAHEYLLEHYKEFDFFWLSPPCPTHSDIRRCGVHSGQTKALYPDMMLYQEIILLMNFAPKNCFWVVENVKPYYKPLIEPTAILQRHLFWSNFKITKFEKKDNREVKHEWMSCNSTLYGFNVGNKNLKNSKQKVKVLRNLVNPELANHILNCALNIETEQLEQIKFEFKQST